MRFLFRLLLDVINISGLSIHADEFVPTAPVPDIGFETIQSSNIAEPEPYIQSEQILNFESHDMMQHEQPLILGSQRYEPDLLNLSVEQKPEPEMPIAQPTEPKSKPVIESSVNEAAVASVAVVATTAAVAAAAVGVAKAAPSKAKPTDAKKPEVKSKVAPAKKAPVTVKVLNRPSATKTDDKPKTAASRVAPRTGVAPKVSSTTERKPISSTTARKPLSNGSKYKW